MTPGPVEMIVILIVALLVFGKRLPEVGRSLGKSFFEFRRGLQEIKQEINIDLEKELEVRDPIPEEYLLTCEEKQAAEAEQKTAPSPEPVQPQDRNEATAAPEGDRWRDACGPRTP